MKHRKWSFAIIIGIFFGCAFHAFAQDNEEQALDKKHRGISSLTLEEKKRKESAHKVNRGIEQDRDPFAMSNELLRQNMSNNYVSFKGENLSKFNLPRIEITGVMAVGSKVMATANIESLGSVTIKPDDKIVPQYGRTKRFSSFLVKKITPSELVIETEGGYVINGRFR